MRLLKVSATMLFFMILSGCAYVSSYSYDASDYTNGIRIPDQIPLLVVTGSETKVIYAGNPNKGSALRFGSFLAKHNFEATFSAGNLTSIKSDQDTTEVGLKLIELVQKSIVEGTQIADAFSSKDGETSGAGNRYGVFKFEFDELGDFVGLTPLISSSGLIVVPQQTTQIIQQSGPLEVD